ncbi:hypothetical protein AL060_03720 [Pseudomonas syringae pv. rhaphiolepidis]|nr:hypothetical protein AL060_03720 [Pseudomonas syringae pv. rhaphiolepidis]
MSYARGAHGECYPAIFLIGTMSTKRFAGGALKASSSKCMIACELNGVSGKNALTARQQRSWIHSRPAVLLKAVTAATTQAKK